MLITNKKFWPLFWTQFLGAFNDNLYKNALVLLITFKSVSIAGVDSAGLVAAAGGIFIFPFFIFSALGGQLADKFEKSLMFKIVNFSEFIVMCLGALGLYLDHYGLLLIVLFFMGAQSAFFGPLKYGLIPRLVKREQLVTGNAYVSGSTFIAILLGTIVGGLSVASEDAKLVTSLLIITLAFGGFVISHFLQKINIRDESIKIDKTLVISTYQTVRHAFSDKTMAKTIIGISWFWFLGASILSVLPAICKETFFLDEKGATLFLAMFTIGIGTGAMFTSRLTFKKVEVGISPIALLIMGFLLFDFYYASITFVKGTFPLRVLIDLFLITFVGAQYIIPLQSLMQVRANKQELSRIIGANNIVNAIFMVAAAVSIMLFYKLGYKAYQVSLLLGILSIIFSFLFYHLFSEKSLRYLGEVLSHTLYDLKIEGQENLPKEGPYIIAANHVSFVDWLLIMAASHKPVRFIIDHAYYYVPMGPFWFKQAKLIPIATRRESPEILEKAFKWVENDLNQGAILGIFPEGRLTRDGKMGRFQPGITKILSNNPVPVIPVVLIGVWGSAFSHRYGLFKKINPFKKRKVTIKILDSIKPENFDLIALETMMRREIGDEKEGHYS